MLSFWAASHYSQVGAPMATGSAGTMHCCMVSPARHAPAPTFINLSFCQHTLPATLPAHLASPLPVHPGVLCAGKDFVHQLNMVCKVIGSPSPAEIAAVPSDKARSYLTSMPFFPKGGERAGWGLQGLQGVSLWGGPASWETGWRKVSTHDARVMYVQPVLSTCHSCTVLPCPALPPLPACRLAAVLSHRQCTRHRPAGQTAHI